MITFANHTMLDDLTTIRKTCFQEEEKYIRFYFAARFTPDNTLVYIEHNRAVASLTLLPATMVTPDGTFPVRYIYAVATLPDFRNRGIATALLKYADALLPAQNVKATLLAPASENLYQYYSRLGYTTCFYRKKAVLHFSDIHTGTPIASTPDIEPLEATVYLRLREKAYAVGGYFVRWEQPALSYALEECANTGGCGISLRRDNDEGFFLACPEAGNVVIKESLLSPPLFPHALHYIIRKFGDRKPLVLYQSLFQTLPAGYTAENTVEPFAMLKTYTPEAQPPPSSIPYFGLAKD